MYFERRLDQAKIFYDNWFDIYSWLSEYFQVDVLC